MFQILVPSAEIAAIATMKDSNEGTALRLKCPTTYKFKRSGEIPAEVLVIVPREVSVKGLSLGQMVEVKGVGHVGRHPFTKKEFGKESTREYDNHYYTASSIKIIDQK